MKYKLNRRWAKIHWTLSAVNLISAGFQLYFAYSNLVNHSWWALANILIFSLNIWTAYMMFKTAKGIHQQERQSIMNVLSGRAIWENS